MNEIWDIPADTFKNKAIVVFGQKVNSVNTDTILGRRIRKAFQMNYANIGCCVKDAARAWSFNPNAQV